MSEAGDYTQAVRPRTDADDEWMLGVHNADEFDALPLSIELFRTEIEHNILRGTGEWSIVDLDGNRAGYVALTNAWWTGRTDVLSLSVHVHADFRRRGAGSALIVHAVQRVAQRDASRMLAWVRQDADGSIEFARKHGFVPTGEVIDDYRLELANTNTQRVREVMRRIETSGVRIASLAEIGVEDTAAMRAVQRMWAELEERETTSAELQREFGTWLDGVTQGPGRTAETHWVAYSGSQPVGATFLRRLTPLAAENDFTGVVPSARGRGIGKALKIRAIDWAQGSKLQWFYTSHAIDNAHMITINRELGYQRGSRRVQMVRDLMRERMVEDL